MYPLFDAPLGLGSRDIEKGELGTFAPSHLPLFPPSRFCFQYLLAVGLSFPIC